MIHDMREHFSSVTILIPIIKAGDQAAWQQLCNKFRAALKNKASKLLLGSKIEQKVTAEDLVQETLLKAWRARDSFTGKTTAQLAKWLMTICRNTFLDWIKPSLCEFSPPTWFEFSNGLQTPSAVIIREEDESKLYACLAELDEQTQRVIMLRHFQGLKFHEIAEVEDANSNTVASLYRRGVTRLRELAVS